MNLTWSDEQIAQLRELFAQNKSFRQIAKVMERSRNAVIGKANRLGLFAPPVKRPVAKRVQIRPGQNMSRRREVEVIDAVEIRDIAPDQSAFACTIADLKHDSCRWPLDEVPSAAMRYCGAVKFNGASYCARHLRIAWKPGVMR